MPHVFSLDGDTPRRGRIVLIAKMKKDCAATPAPYGSNVEIEHNDQIIKLILPPKQLMRLGTWETYGAIVGAALRAITPAKARLDRLQFRVWAQNSVGAVKSA